MNRLLTTKIVYHHSVTPQRWDKEKTVDLIARSHIQRGLNAPGGDISYHFLIGHNWTYQCRPMKTVGYHAGHYPTNLTSVAICLVGNFNVDTPTLYQNKELARLTDEIQDKYGVLKRVLHRDIKSTACPGYNVTIDTIESILNKYGKLNPMIEKLQKEIRALNTEIGRVTKERDTARDNHEKEVQSHKDTLEHLRGAEADREKITKEKNKYKDLAEKCTGAESKYELLKLAILNLLK